MFTVIQMCWLQGHTGSECNPFVLTRINLCDRRKTVVVYQEHNYVTLNSLQQS